MKMISNILDVINIKKKTNAKMFKDLNIGDKIQCSIEIKRAGKNRSTYASYIKIENIKTKDSTVKSFNEIGVFLSNFELREIIKD